MCEEYHPWANCDIFATFELHGGLNKLCSILYVNRSGVSHAGERVTALDSPVNAIALLSDSQCLNCRGVGGVEPPQLFAQPPQTRCPGIPRGGSVSTPPPLLMMLNCLCVMTMTMNRQMSTPPPTYFLTIQTLVTARNVSFCKYWRICHSVSLSFVLSYSPNPVL
jgi:hypothetical protein